MLGPRLLPHVTAMRVSATAWGPIAYGPQLYAGPKRRPPPAGAPHAQSVCKQVWATWTQLPQPRVALGA